MPFVRSIS